ncbi:hypothetical protein PQX77_011902 [Marasmius sp. AFHP31]|nr:hypothetical protein PQX77_011902 [Marasmius sp. AFHP31]
MRRPRPSRDGQPQHGGLHVSELDIFVLVSGRDEKGREDNGRNGRNRESSNDGGGGSGNDDDDDDETDKPKPAGRETTRPPTSRVSTSIPETSDSPASSPDSSRVTGSNSTPTSSITSLVLSSGTTSSSVDGTSARTSARSEEQPSTETSPALYDSSATTPTPTLPIPRHPNQQRAIAGGVSGVIAFLLLLLLCAFLFIRARRQRSRPTSRPHTFYKDRMIKDVEEVPPTPLTPNSIVSSGPDGASRTSLCDPLQVNFGGDPALGLGLPSRTSRQMQIEQKIFELQSSLISLNRRTISLTRSNRSSKEAQARLIKDNIGRLEKLKEGDWAREKSDEKPADMM